MSRRHRSTASLVGSGSVGLIMSATAELRDKNAYVALFRTNSVSCLLKRHLILFPYRPVILQFSFYTVLYDYNVFILCFCCRYSRLRVVSVFVC